MIFVSRFQLSLTAIAAAALVFSVGYEWRQNVRLRTELAAAKAATSSRRLGLWRQIGVEKQHVQTAEAHLADLLQRVSDVRAASRAVGSAIPADEAVKAALARAAQLIKEGKKQAALEMYLACYRDVRAARLIGPEAQNLLWALAKLGRDYPEARDALAALRDKATADWKAGNVGSDLIREIAFLNERLGEGTKSIALYDALPATDEARPLVAAIAQEEFIAARRYAEVLPIRSYGNMVRLVDGGVHLSGVQTPTRQAAAKQYVVETTLTNIEILTGAGRVEDAQALTGKLLAFDNSEATQAELQRHLDRARGAAR